MNNAGISRLQPFDQIGEQVWDEVLAVNLKSVFLVTQAVLPGMREKRWGRIINISSVAAQTGGVIGPHYAASKAGNRPFCWRAVCPHNRRILQATSPNDNTKALVATHAQPLYGILEGWPVVIIWPHGRKTVRGSPR